jgi:peptidoglycan hydrolase CwlO-like protein
MTTQTKDKITNLVGTIIASVIIMFISLWATGVVDAKKSNNQRIDAKVERSEFEKCTKETKELFDKKLDITVFEKHEKSNDEKFQSSQDNLKEIKAEIQGIRSDARLDAKELRNEIIQILKDQRRSSTLIPSIYDPNYQQARRDTGCTGYHSGLFLEDIRSEKRD